MASPPLNPLVLLGIGVAFLMVGAAQTYDGENPDTADDPPDPPTPPGPVPNVPDPSGWGNEKGPCWVVNVGGQHYGEFPFPTLQEHNGVKEINRLDDAVKRHIIQPITLSLDGGRRSYRDTGTVDVFLSDTFSHTHTVVLSIDHLQKLSRGETVEVRTSGPTDNDDAHTHLMTFKCVGK